MKKSDPKTHQKTKVYFLRVLVLLLGLQWAGTHSVQASSVEVVQSVPLETTLAVPGVRFAQEVWLEMIASAQSTLDIEQFYISNQKDEALEPILKSIEAAAQRHVKVRLIVDKVFYATYPESVERLAKAPGLEKRIVDYTADRGVQHAKFFIVDQKQVFVGSQNFDWRALTQIHEIGLKIEDEKTAAALRLVFEKDWAPSAAANALPQTLNPNPSEFQVLASPPHKNPREVSDTLSALTKLISTAQKSIKIEVMDYAGKFSLDGALREAAARGVQILLAVDASSAKRSMKALKSLASVKNIEIRTVKIPQWSGGPIEFARLIHSKFMIVDDTTAWVGTENWAENYFKVSRNVGILLQTPSVIENLGKVFQAVWGSGYVSKVQ